MSLLFSPEQCRVLGVLLEKEITTPDQYPLSLNSLTNACNQKSNREPVMNLSEAEVQNTLDELMKVNQISDEGAFSGRVAKYSHRFCNTQFGDLKLNAGQRAIICVLFLRGPQTPGELRTRTNRLADFANVTEVEKALTELKLLDGVERVVKLAREPGKRESRYAHTFTDVDYEADIVGHSAYETQTNQKPKEESLELKIEELEQKIALLTSRIDTLEELIN